MAGLQDELTESHKDLRQWLLLHQECLLLGDDEQARQSWQAFCRYLTSHLEFENRYILKPDTAGQYDLHWPLSVYRKEHDKLLAMQREIGARLEQYFSFAGRYKRLALLELLDDEQRFVHVLEHHEEREEKDLFKVLSLLSVHKDLCDKWQQVNATLVSENAEMKEQLQGYLSGV